MLNEIKEYEEYTLPIESLADVENPRLKFFTLIKKSFSGLERALTIIARHYINDAAEIDEEKIKNYLREWLGFEVIDSENNKINERRTDGWLNNYIRKVFLENLLQECRNKCAEFEKISDISSTDEIDDLMKKKDALPDFDSDKSLALSVGQLKYAIEALYKLRYKAKLFENPMFSVENEKTPESKQGNNFKQITYDLIIANAINLGALQKYYLVCKNDPFQNVIKYSEKKNKCSKLKATDEDLILKIAATYLLQRLYSNSNQEYLYVNQMEICNWLLERANPDKFELEKYKIQPSNEKIFYESIIGGNVKKIKVHPEFISNFEIVEESKLIENDGRIFFSDFGANFYLSKNKRY